MRTITQLTVLCAGMLCTTWALAQQPPAGAPAGSTGLCKDGTYWSGATKKGACHGHKGVKDWYGSASETGSTGAAGSASSTAPAAAPAAGSSATGPAPAGSTGLCNDGTYWSGATKRGACRGHKGVKDWYGGGSATGSAGAAGSASSAAPAAAPAAGTSATAPAPAASPAPTPHTAAKTPSAPAAEPAPGGGAGQVWVNHKSKVYHCQGDRWYGKTKDGEYMTEAAATSAGYRPDHGKACK
jgi:hypothetical protein